MLKNIGAFVLLIVFLFSSCKEKDYPFKDLNQESFAQFRNDSFTFSEKSIRKIIDSLRIGEHDKEYTDIEVNKYYANGGAFLWIDRNGIDNRCDTLLLYTNQLSELGISSRLLYHREIQNNLHRFRELNFSERNINHVLAFIEYYSTKAYLRYVNGQRFGFVNPRKYFNSLDTFGDSTDIHYHVLYDVPTERISKKFLRKAISSINNPNMKGFLDSIQPKDSMYYRMVREYKKPYLSKYQRNALICSMERLRWRTNFHPKGKYVFVNIPQFSLRAVDETKDTSLTMRIVCGRLKNKTPLLTSNIERLDLNPYWNVPQSIIKNEIAPKHSQDAAYFERNRMNIIDKATGENVSPENVTEEMLKSGNYRVQQEKGEGNSLGRMIFRFNNNFAVFLHDTDNRNAFSNSWRGLSHGCIRLERPLDLAIFLLDKRDEKIIDRFRLAIDLPSLTEEGSIDTQKEGYKHISFYKLKRHIPLYINYFTAYPSIKGDIMEYHSDVYGYDSVILKKLKRL